MLLILTIAAALADPPKASIEGYSELRGSVSLGVTGTPWQLVERVRPELSVPLSDNVVFTVTPEAQLVEGRNLQNELQSAIDESELGQYLLEAGCVWPDSTVNDTLHVSKASDYLSVQRMYLDVYTKRADLRIGRQPVQWGSALFFHPTDPFPEILVVEPWRERSGVNAARVSVPYGSRESDLIQGMVATNDSLTSGRAALRATKDIGGTDVSLIGAYRGDDSSGLVGVDIKGTAGVGFWLEGAAHVDPTPNGDTPKVYEEFAVGVDYSFPVLDTLLIGAQYYRNGSGESDPDDYQTVSRTSQSLAAPECDDPDLAAAFAAQPSDPFGSFTQGKDYVVGQISQAFTQDVRLSAVDIHNLRDGSGVFVPNLRISAGGNVDFTLTAQVPYRVGRQRTGEFKPAPAEQVLRIPGVPGDTIDADLSGIVADASIIAYARYHF